MSRVTIHDLVQCGDCDWQWCLFADTGKGGQKSQAHANKTGHSVNRETGQCYSYKPK